MIHIISSKATKASPSLKYLPRKARQDNLSWLENSQPQSGESSLVMVGGKGPLEFRLRAAQSHVRHDLLPSYWSHVMLLDKPAKNLADTPVYEISLNPSAGFGFPPPTNGVQIGRLGHYQKAEEYPNICILHAPVDPAAVKQALHRFQMQRAVLDAVDLTVRWVAYAWGVANSPNPLLASQGMPSAAMIEVVLGAAGFDLTPGLESRASCPEAIWQAAKWWHIYYEEQKRQPLRGAFFCGHKF